MQHSSIQFEEHSNRIKAFYSLYRTNQFHFRTQMIDWQNKSKLVALFHSLLQWDTSHFIELVIQWDTEQTNENVCGNVKRNKSHESSWFLCLNALLSTSFFLWLTFIRLHQIRIAYWISITLHCPMRLKPVTTFRLFLSSLSVWWYTFVWTVYIKFLHLVHAKLHVTMWQCWVNPDLVAYWLLHFNSRKFPFDHSTCLCVVHSLLHFWFSIIGSFCLQTNARGIHSILQYIRAGSDQQGL